ncbi:integrator complex subunit 1-like [Sycon ciliatum]|uniref:integrator complex subunit 1-like n=1 Tax=Sycon ciliatum TaxID=27933 RepID=UPI0031F63477
MNRPNNARRRQFPARAGLPPTEIFALGSKSEESSVAPPPPSAAIQREDGPPAKRRIAPPSAGMIPIASSTTPSSSNESILFSVPQRQVTAPGHLQTASNLPVIEVPPAEFAEKIQEVLACNDIPKVEGIICGTLKQLKENRTSKPHSGVLLCLMNLAKSHQKLFTTTRMIQALAEVLRHDPSAVRGVKANPSPAATVCSILMFSFEDDRNWPDSLVHAFIEDSLHERTWVDRDCCRKFVENLVTAFGTVMPSQQQLNDLGFGSSRPQLTPAHSTTDISEGNTETGSSRPATPSAGEGSGTDTNSIKVVSRYHSPNSLASFRQTVMHHVGEILARRPNQPIDNVSRNSLRFLTSVAGLASVRQQVVPRLEQWMQNTKFQRHAHELLLTVCMNTGGSGHEENDIINKLVQIRLKHKQYSEKYVTSMKELLTTKHPENPPTLINCIIFNELASQRNPNNMAMLNITFQHDPVNAPKALAFTFQNLLLRDDYCRALRSLLREIVKQMRGEIDLGAFAMGLHIQRQEIIDHPELHIRERIVHSLVDLTCLACLLAVQPCLRDNSAPVVQKCQHMISRAIRDAMHWVHKVMPHLTKLTADDLKKRIRKLLFMENPELYTVEGWPSEVERNGMLHFITNAPLREETLITLLVIGLSDLPFSPQDALEYGDRLVQRAANVHTTAHPTLHGIDNAETIFRIVMKCALYRAPANIILPEGCVPPRLAISQLYWKGCVLLLTLAVYNPKTVGIYAWKGYPVLHCLMEMVMTNTFVYPPSIGPGQTREEIIARDHQKRQLEIEEILAYENHLSQACNRPPVTEVKSLLVNTVIHCDESGGPARRPQKDIIERLRASSKRLKLGDRLCRSRDPDFLLDVINAQGASQSMSWLSELVANSEGSGSVDLLPTPCLCEFLMAHSEAELDANAWAPVALKDHMQHVLKVKRDELEARIRGLLCGEDCTLKGTVEVLDYFFKKLSSDGARSRRLSLKCLSSVLTNTGSQRMLSATTPMDVVETPVPKDDDAFDVELLLEESLASTKRSPGAAIGISSLPVEDIVLSASLKDEFGWLLVDLPRLKHFKSAVLPCTISSLRAACMSESDPSVIRAFICFLAEHTPKSDVASVAKDFADMVVKRPNVCDQVLGTSSCSMTRTSSGDEETCSVVLTALLKLFSRAIQLASQEKEVLAAWDKDATQLVQFPTGEMVALHVFIVHAVIGLLCKMPSLDNPLYEAVLDLWFPESGALTTAYLLDSHDEAVMFSGTLRPKIVLSSNQRLLDAVLHSSTVTQLVHDLYLFGVPLVNASKIIQALEKELARDQQSLDSPEVDKAYLCRVLRVLKRRGVQGGQEILQMLDGYEVANTGSSARHCGLKPVVVKEEAEEEKMDVSPAARLPHIDIPKSIEKWHHFVRKLFIEVDLSHARPLVNTMAKVLQASLSAAQQACTRKSGVKREIVHGEVMDGGDMVCAAFSRILNSDESEVFATALSERSSASCRILQLLSARQAILTQQGKPSSHFVHLLEALVGFGRHMQGGAFAHSLALAAKKYGRSLQPIADTKAELEAALGELVPKCFTRIKKEVGVRPPSYTCISEQVLSDFVVQRAVKAVRAAKDAGTEVDEKLLRTALEELCHCCSMHLERVVDVIFSPSPTTGKLLLVSCPCPATASSGMPSNHATSTIHNGRNGHGTITTVTAAAAAVPASSAMSNLVHLACSILSNIDAGVAVGERSPRLSVNVKEDGESEQGNSPTSPQDIPKKSPGGYARLGGLLIDRLQLLDPELTQIAAGAQRRLLFSRSSGQSRSLLDCTTSSPSDTAMDMDDRAAASVFAAASKGDASCQESTELPSNFRQSLLVSLLAHQSSWSSLAQKMHWLFDDQHVNRKDTDASVTLDFIDACLNLPRLRQGRVRKDYAMGAESRGVGEDRLFLHLSTEHVRALVKLVLKECQDMAPSPSDTGVRRDALQDCPRLTRRVQSRVTTLLAASDSSEAHLAVTVRALLDSRDSAGLFVLVHLYMTRPSILEHVDIAMRPSLFSCTLQLTDTECVWDSSIQSFIGSMSQPSIEETSSAEQNADSYLKCRFLAGVHPTLFLRHLGVLSSTLLGRTHLSFQVFQGRQHHIVFTYVLSLLDSARPYVFHSSLRDHLLSIVVAFTDMLQQYCLCGKALGSLADRIGQFLLLYLKESGEVALTFLKSKLSLWKDLTQVHKTSESLRELERALSSLAECASTIGQAQAEQSSASGGVPHLNGVHTGIESTLSSLDDVVQVTHSRDNGSSAGSATADDAGISAEKLAPFLHSLEPGEASDGLYCALVELDDASMRCPAILEHCLSHLELLLTHSPCQATLLAIKLLIRYIRNNPKSTDRFIPAFLVCLQSNSRAVVNAIIAAIPELVIFSSKFSRRLLTESYEASVKHSLESSNALLVRGLKLCVLC